MVRNAARLYYDVWRTLLRHGRWLYSTTVEALLLYVRGCLVSSLCIECNMHISTAPRHQTRSHVA